MATTPTRGFAIPGNAFDDSAFAPARRTRHVSAEAGRAFRLLGHAIEYLANEFLHDSVPPSAHNARLQAVQMLMGLNREIYGECPEEAEPLSFGDRCRGMLRARSR